MTRIPSLWLTTVLVAGLAMGCSGSPTSPPTPQCVYTVSASTLTVPSAGGAGTVAVTAGTSCGWTATTSTAWINLTSGATGTGNGSVSFSAQANTTTAARTGSLLVAGTTVTVQQDGLAACSYAINPTSAAIDEEGGQGQVMVSSASHCAWQAVANVAWLSVSASGNGTGNGAVTYVVAGNPSPLPRSGTLTIAGHTFTVQQAGDIESCTYQVSPVQLSVCMAWTVDLTASIATQDGCPWTASAAVEWISVTEGASGSGSGVVRLRGTDNYEARRTGIVQVRWPAVTAGQNLVIDQAGCSYAVTRSDFSFTAAAGTGQFDVLQQADPNTCGGPLQNGCVWSAVSSASWVTVTSAMPRAGDNPVNFSVAENPTTSSRTAAITVRDKVVTITQAGR